MKNMEEETLEVSPGDNTGNECIMFFKIFTKLLQLHDIGIVPSFTIINFGENESFDSSFMCFPFSMGIMKVKLISHPISILKTMHVDTKTLDF